MRLSVLSRKIFAAVLGGVLALASASSLDAQMVIVSGARYTPTAADSGAGTTSCYDMTSGVKALVPWDGGSGNYGAQHQYTPHTTPTTNRTVYVSNESEFETEAAVSGSQIIFDANIAESVVLNVGSGNLNIIIPQEFGVGAIQLNAAYDNIRIGGPTSCSHSGGKMNTFWGAGGNITLDGIDIVGYKSDGGDEVYRQCVRFDNATGSLAIVHVRMLCPLAGVNFGDNSELFCQNSNIMAGAANDSLTPGAGQWALRWESGPVYSINCDWRNDHYATMRLATITGVSLEYFFSTQSTFVNYAEYRTFWIWHDANSNGDGPGDGFVSNTDVFAGFSDGISCDAGGPMLDTDNTGGGADVTYSRVSNATAYSAGTPTTVVSQSSFNTQDARSSDGDWTSGNTFPTWSADLAWDSDPGDPTLLTMPNGTTFSLGNDISGCDVPGFAP